MLNIGCHLSISKGFAHIGIEAKSIGANTFQFFTRNPQGGKAKELDSADVEKYNSYASENGFAPIVAHAPYTLNPCSEPGSLHKWFLPMIYDECQKFRIIIIIFTPVRM